MSSPDEKKDRTASTKGQPLNAQAQAGKTNTNAKYRDPDNPFHTWTGIGKRPKWLRSYLEQGRKLEEFLIEQDGEDDG